MTDAVEVTVSIDGEDLDAGVLRPSRRKGRDVGATWSYNAGYLADPRAYPIDPRLPLREGSQHTRPGQLMFGALTDCSPDRWGRILMQRAQRSASQDGHATRQLAELDYLLGARDDLRQGALRFRGHRDGPFLADGDHGVPALTDLAELLDLADRADDDDLVAEELARLVRAGSSLGGARPKAHVRTVSGEAAIAKFPSAQRDTWDVMAWEAVTLTLARGAGIRVPEFQLIQIGGRSVLVLNRFDRQGQLTGAGASVRVGYVSAMTMLEATDGDVGDFLDLVEVAEQHSPAATEDIHELWRRAVFSALVSNTDNHLRNHGYLRTATGWRLAPAFDLNPNPDASELAVGVDGRFIGVVDTAMACAELFRLDREDAQETLDEIVESVAGWERVASANRLDAQAVRRMRPAFHHAEAARAADL